MRLPQQLVQYEPRVAGPLADAAVSHHAAVRVVDEVGVDAAQLVVGSEGAVARDGPVPRHGNGAGDVPALAPALLGQAGGRGESAGELVDRPDVHERVGAEAGQDVLAKGADRQVLLVGHVLGPRAVGQLGLHRQALALPLHAPAVEESHVGVAVEPQVPVGVRGEPVVIAAVDHDRVVAGDAALGHQFAEAFAVDQVADELLLQVGPPVQCDGAGDMSVGVVGRHVLVDLEEDHRVVGQARGGPAGADQNVLATHTGESSGHRAGARRAAGCPGPRCPRR